jgi:hypothetical protein
MALIEAPAAPPRRAVREVQSAGDGEIKSERERLFVGQA